MVELEVTSSLSLELGLLSSAQSLHGLTGSYGLRLCCWNNELASRDRNYFKWIIKYLQRVHFV